MLYDGTRAPLGGRLRLDHTGFVRWTPDRHWARHHGRYLYRRSGANLHPLQVDGETARDACDAIMQAGVDITGLRPPDAGDDERPEAECHQYLTGTPGLAARVRAAGYDGVCHSDIREHAGIGVAVALVA